MSTIIILFNLLSLMCDSWSALLIKYSKKLYFLKDSCGTFCFLMPRLFGVALFQLNAIGNSVFRKSAKVLIFVRLISRAEFCRGYTVWIAFAGFITFECIITFVVNYYICGFNIPPPSPDKSPLQMYLNEFDLLLSQW